jgi:NAD(P)-dependent dehydrogenase (short-subunit alcohol dehydrogenase family)
MLRRLDGKVCIVTGTGGSMGRATALTFAREGASVVGCDVIVEPAVETVEMVHDPAMLGARQLGPLARATSGHNRQGEWNYRSEVTAPALVATRTRTIPPQTNRRSVTSRPPLLP